MDLVRNWIVYLYSWVKEQKAGYWKYALYEQEKQILTGFFMYVGKD